MSKKMMLTIWVAMALTVFPHYSQSACPDLTGDSKTDLNDVIKGLQILTNISVSSIPTPISDIEGDSKIGLSDLSYMLQIIAELRQCAAYTVVDTGQIGCYGNSAEMTCPISGMAYYGQDAQSSGRQPSYTLNSDGKTVYDNNTGLTWMNGPNTTHISPVATDKMTYTAALTWVNTVNAAQYGGYSDWRLPSVRELYSLIKFSGTDPSGYSGTDTSVLTPFIDKTYFNFAYGQTSANERIIDSQYASSNVFVLNPGENGYTMLFGVNFADGRIKGYDLKMPGGSDKTFFVQLVRGNAYGINSFKDNGDQTVTDSATGLMWSKNDSGSDTPNGMIWQDALAYVQTKNAAKYLGYGDWRLPNAKELQSIVNYANAPGYNGKPAVDDTFFNCTAITNENGDSDYPYYWTSTTHVGYSDTGTTGGSAVYIPFGRALGYSGNLGKWIDVHGAGCQRSDPKIGPPFSFSSAVKTYTVIKNGKTYIGYSFGPQGDALRNSNFVRLVRGGL